MMAKPIRALELHYPMIQFLIKYDISCYYVIDYNNLAPWSLIDEAEARISPSTSSTRDLGTRWWASLSSDVFWAAHVNRKLAFFSLYTPWCYLICIAKCIYSYGDDLSKNIFQIAAQEWKQVHFQSTCVAQKRRYFKNSLINRPNYPKRRLYRGKKSNPWRHKKTLEKNLNSQVR